MENKELVWYLSNGDVIEDDDAYDFLNKKMIKYETLISQKLNFHISTNKNITISPKKNVNNLVGINFNNSLINELFVLSKYRYLNITNEANVDTAKAIAVTMVAEDINCLKIAEVMKSATTDIKPRKQ